jgi:hypothetical protein
MTSYLTIENNTQDTWMVKIGPDKAAVQISSYVLAGTSAVCALLGGSVMAGAALVASLGTGITAAKWASELSVFVKDKLTNDGFIQLDPGSSHRYGKMTLSLWQQCECYRFTSTPVSVRLDRLWMRPIFSGGSHDSNNIHKIQWWIEKWGCRRNSKVSFKAQNWPNSTPAPIPNTFYRIISNRGNCVG